jgi:hypothetical protein
VRAAEIEIRQRRSLLSPRIQGHNHARLASFLNSSAIPLGGLDSIVGAHDGFGRPSYAELAIEFPHFGLPALVGKELKISASDQDLEKAASPWQALASQLAKNPRADAKLGLPK